MGRLSRSFAVVALVVASTSTAVSGPAAASENRPAVTVSPARPVPGDTVSFTGRLGSDSRPIVLQRRLEGSWRPVTRGQSRRGAYRLVTRSRQSTTRYRIVAPARSGGLARLVSRERVVKQATGPYMWAQHRTCRRERLERPPSYEACDRVDAVFKRIGRLFVHRFHEAAQRGDVQRLREMSMEGQEVAQQFEGVDVTSLHGCYYFTSDTEWACYMRLADAPDERIDFRAQVVAWVEDEFPVYQVISAERVA